MRLTRIELRSFRSHTDTDIPDLERINWFGGYNGVGKSSIADGIAVALSGTTWGYEGGQHLDELRSTIGDPPCWSVRLHVDWGGDNGPGGIDRREGQGPKSKAQAEINSITGLAPETIRTVLYSGELMRMLRSGEYKKLRAMLMSLAGERRVTLADEHRTVLRESILPDPKEVNGTELDKLHKQAYQERTKVGRLVKSAGGKVAAPELPEILRGIKTTIPDDLEKLRELGQAARTQLDDLRSGLEDKHGSRERAEATLEGLRDTVERCKRQLEAEQDRIDSLPLSREQMAKRVKDMAAEMRQNAKTEKSVETKLNQQNDALGVILAEERAHKRRIEAARGLGDKCTECGQKVSKTAKQRLEKNRRAELEVAARQRQEVELALSQLKQTRDELPDRVAIATQLAKLERAQELLVEAEQAKTKLQRELGQAIEKLKEATQLVEQSDDADDETDIRNRIAKGEQIYSALMHYGGALQEYEQGGSASESVVAKHEQLDALVVYLDECKAELAGSDETLGVLEAVQQDLGDLGFEAELAPLLDSEEPRVNGRRARLLSVSEQLRLGIAVQIALARWSGLGIVLVDQWELLDREVAESCLRLLEDSELQVFIFGKIRSTEAWTDAGEECDPGTKFYLIGKEGEESRVIPIPSALHDRVAT